MIEQQNINGKDVWLKIDPQPMQRSNPNIIPTEYFTASYYLQSPDQQLEGEIMKDEEGLPRLFESPVAALTFVQKRLQDTL